MILESDLALVGKVNKTHGVNGEVSVSFDDPDEMACVCPGTCLLMKIDGILVPFFAQSVRSRGAGALLISFDDICSQPEAAVFTGLDVYMRTSDLPETEDGDSDGLYASDLIGYTAVCTPGITLGTVTDIDDTTENTLFIISRPDGGDVLVPVADEFIEEIDTENKKLLLDLPDGLIETNI